MILKRNIINLLVFLLPLIILFFVKDLSFNNDIWLSKYDKVDIANQYRKSEFLNNKEALIVKININDGFFNQKIIENVRDLVDEIENIKDVFKVRSPLHSSYISNNDEILNIQTFNSALENNIIKDLNEFEKEFTKSDYFGLLLSKDYKKFILDIKVDIGEIDKHQKRQNIIKQIEEILQKDNFDNHDYAGKLFLDYQLNELSKDNLIKLFLIAILVICMILYFIYRNITKLFITLYVALIASFTSLLVIKFYAEILTTINIILPLVIIAIAISDGVHIIAKWQYLSSLKQYQNAFDRLKRLIKLTYKPCLVTSVTTAIGFGSFYFGNIVPLKDFAVQSVISISLAYILITCLTWILVYVNNIEVSNKVNFNILVGQIPALVKRVNQKRKIVAMTTIMILIIFGYGMTKIYSQSSFLDIFFKKNSTIHQSFVDIDESLGGSGEVDLIINSAKEEEFKKIENLNLIRELSNNISKYELVNHVRSYKNPIKTLHEEIRNDESEFPQNNDEFAQEILFLEFSRNDSSNDVLSKYVNFNYSAARLNIKTNNLDSKDIKKLVSQIRKGNDGDFILTGHNMYFYQISHYVNQIQIKSILITIFTIFIVMIIFYNLKTSLIALLLNLIPIIIVAGLIAYLNIAFDFATVMISAIGFAIAIDNSIHLIDNYSNIKQKDQIEKAIENLRYIARPLTINTILFSAVFLVFSYADLVLLIKFGIFSFITIICAYLANLILSVITLRD